LLKCPQPIVFWVDATFAGMIDFYPEFSNLSQISLRKGNAQEQAALTNCSLAIYASEWAAETAVKNYQVDTAKIRVVPFGANLACDRTEEDILNFLKLRSPKMCKLLFFGVEWHRKGGDLALELTRMLNKNGLKTELTIIGCDPLVNGPLPEFVKVYGFMDKTSRKGLAKIEEILSKTHFLIHPARAEAYGCVVCEANSFGVPCLVANVGGLSTPIKDDINGRLFPPNESIEAYGNFVMDVFGNYNKYNELFRSSFQKYQSRLNWNVAGMTVKKMLAELI
jgi:glycosyltransferase involved in cell wall biosynthesis